MLINYDIAKNFDKIESAFYCLKNLILDESENITYSEFSDFVDKKTNIWINYIHESGQIFGFIGEYISKDAILSTIITCSPDKIYPGSGYFDLANRMFGYYDDQLGVKNYKHLTPQNLAKRLAFVKKEKQKLLKLNNKQFEKMEEELKKLKLQHKS